MSVDEAVVEDTGRAVGSGVPIRASRHGDRIVVGAVDAGKAPLPHTATRIAGPRAFGVDHHSAGVWNAQVTFSQGRALAQSSIIGRSHVAVVLGVGPSRSARDAGRGLLARMREEILGRHRELAVWPPLVAEVRGQLNVENLGSGKATGFGDVAV